MIIPHRSRIVVRPDAAQEKTEGGIILAEEAKKKPTTGVVIAVGEGTYLSDGTLVPTAAQVDQHVIFEQYTGIPVKDSGEDLLIMDDGDVLAHINS